LENSAKYVEALKKELKKLGEENKGFKKLFQNPALASILFQQNDDGELENDFEFMISDSDHKSNRTNSHRSRYPHPNLHGSLPHSSIPSAFLPPLQNLHPNPGPNPAAPPTNNPGNHPPATPPSSVLNFSQMIPPNFNLRNPSITDPAFHRLPQTLPLNRSSSEINLDASFPPTLSPTRHLEHIIRPIPQQQLQHLQSLYANKFPINPGLQYHLNQNSPKNLNPNPNQPFDEGH
jgi:hypothetical protein